ncbi:hypothetical protein [Butyrivibrio hungatei]|uniref:hypothetical protein n=1 Tax=Butyrivibrio hungatei TaxID=185008 RepID=UPI0015B43519|nr:hypothetical protein [Butyrivibrio hungatei]
MSERTRALSFTPCMNNTQKDIIKKTDKNPHLHPSCPRNAVLLSHEKNNVIAFEKTNAPMIMAFCGSQKSFLGSSRIFNIKRSAKKKAETPRYNTPFASPSI